MSLTRSHWPLCLAFAATLAAPTLLAAAARTPTTVPETRPQIALATQVTQHVDNDQLEARLFVEQQHSDPQQLSRLLTEALNEANAAVPRDARANARLTVRTGPVHQHPVYNERQRLVGWRGRASISLTATDIPAATALIAQWQSRWQLEDLQFTVSTAVRQQTEQALITAAIQRFRAQADTARQAWGAGHYQLVEMNLGDAATTVPEVRMMRLAVMAEAQDAPQPMAVQPGRSELTLAVRGVIALQP